jgi:hypothetical protein
LWKSLAGDYYCSVGYHWIDDEWIFQSFTTHCTKVETDHTGNSSITFSFLNFIAASIGNLVASCLLDCLGDNIFPFSGVTDGGEIASILMTAKYLSYYIYSY